PVGGALPVPFQAGEPSTGPFTCADGAARTNLSLDQVELTVGETATATALVTDEFCNPVTGTDVTVTVTGAATVAPAVGTTGADGTVTAQVTDATAERVAVTAATPKITVGSEDITFTAGGFSADRSKFTVTPDATITANIQIAGTGAYVGTLTARDANGNPVTALTGITFGASADYITVSAVRDLGDGTYTVTYTSRVADDMAKATVTVDGTPVGTARPVPFVAGTPDPEPVCPAGSPYQTGTSVTADPTTLPVGRDSVVTALVTDANCNPVRGAAVDFTANSVNATLTAAAGVTGPDGTARATVTSSARELVTVTAATGASRIGAARVEFTLGGLSAADSTFTVSPAVTLGDSTTWPVAGVGTYTGILTAKDANQNVLPDLDLTTIAFTASAAYVEITAVTYVGDGHYEVTYSSRVADPGLTAALTVGALTFDPKPIPFQAGTAQPGPFTCTTPLVRPGTSLTANPWDLPAGEDSTVTALVTDANCNPVAGVDVDFTVGQNHAAKLTVVSGVTGSDGRATATLTSTAEETVQVAATTGVGPVGQADVRFRLGAISQVHSSFTVSPAATVGVEESYQLVGTGTYTGTLVARDGHGNPMPDLADVAFAASQDYVTVSGVDNQGEGVYVVTFTSKVADGALTATVTAGGTQIGTAQPIPFRAGEVSVTPDPDCQLDTQAATSLTASPMVLDVNQDSTLTAHIADTYCNPLAEIVVELTVVDGTDGFLSPEAAAGMAVATTDGSGDAFASLTDATAEEVTVAGTVNGLRLAPVTVTFRDPDQPGAPVITSPVDGWVTNADPLRVVGEGQPGSVVTVTAGGTGVCTATADAAGQWSCEASLAEGTHTLVATQQDAAGTVSVPSNAVTVTIDRTAPTAPVVTGPKDGGDVNTSTPEVTGTGEPGATVDVTDGGGNTLCSTTVGPDGTWSCTVTSPLPEGPNEITVTQVDPAGNTSEPTVVTPNIDTEAPPAPVVTGPKDGLDINTSTPEVTGTGEPGATVDVTDGGGNTLCQTTVLPDGTWSCTVTSPLPEGPNEITVTQVDPAGNTSEPTVVKPVVDTVAPAQPVITQANATAVAGTAEPNATLHLTWPDGTTGTTLVDSNGQWSLPTPGNMVSGTVTAVAVDAAGNPSRPATAYLDLDGPGAPDILTANKTEIAGTAEPGTVITVTYPVVDPVTGEAGTKTAGPVTVTPEGTWTLPTPEDAVSGRVEAVATDANGNPSAPGTGYLDVDAPAAPVVTGPKDGGDINTSTPEVTGTGEPGATVDVTDGGGNTLCSTTVVPDGTWSCTVTTPLPEGPNEITVTQVDPAGNTSEPTVVTPNIDTEAPPAPVVTGPKDGVDINTPTPEVTGTGEPGATVDVTDGGGNTLCSTTVLPDGTWSCTVTTPLPEGPNEIIVTQVDPGGNTSDPTVVTPNIETEAPVAPVVTGPKDGGDINTSTPEVTGTGEPGATV
ncbi:MAG: Ig-like domain-containing protein, partial [Propionibacteriaceae bacterium]|nr:Ig-like domain-containing protein [Propionibacteriaceae bacterium]